MTQPLPLSPSPPSTAAKATLPLLYTSHTLSTWNTRAFEFSAVLFLAHLFPSSLLPASLYALIRAAAAVALGGYVGRRVDRANRLDGVRASIVAMRTAVGGSCAGLAVVGWMGGEAGWVRWGVFAGCVGLGCVERLGALGNTVAVERDWVVVIAEETGLPREDLNSTMRRIDLLAKMLAPVFVSLFDAYSPSAALWVVFGQNMVSMLIEYFTIAKVYAAVPGLQTRIPSNRLEPHNSDENNTNAPLSPSSPPPTTSPLHALLTPWTLYTTSPAFLASFSLSLLYLTVLSTGIQLQTYLFSLSFTALHLSLLRLVAVAIELLATAAAPPLMRRIGAVRAGLWFVNWQLVCVAVAGVLYFVCGSGVGEGGETERERIAGWALIAGVAASRFGLWGFDLSVQFLVQDAVPPPHRTTISATETSLQSAFELLSYATTAVCAHPAQFKYPVLMSTVSVAVAAACFAGFVRARRGHLLHLDLRGSRCVGAMRMGKGWGREGYVEVGRDQVEVEVELGELGEGEEEGGR